MNSLKKKKHQARLSVFFHLQDSQSGALLGSREAESRRGNNIIPKHLLCKVSGFLNMYLRKITS
jgi:hypothetical protein